LCHSILFNNLKKEIFVRLCFHRYLMEHLAAWNVVLAASANAIEMGVLGQSADAAAPSAEHPLWTPWTQLDEARAELPLTAGGDETVAPELDSAHSVLMIETNHKRKWIGLVCVCVF